MAWRDLAVNGECAQLKQAASGLLGFVQLFCSAWQRSRLYIQSQASYDSYIWRMRVATAIASCSVRPFTKLAIKSLVNTAKNIHNTNLICSYIRDRHCFGHSFYGKAHGARAAGQYLYCPNHILGDMSIALALVSFTAYSRSAQHFDSPTQQALIHYQHHMHNTIIMQGSRFFLLACLFKFVVRASQPIIIDINCYYNKDSPLLLVIILLSVQP